MTYHAVGSAVAGVVHVQESEFVWTWNGGRDEGGAG